jgi:hypothetical protein
MHGMKEHFSKYFATLQGRMIRSLAGGASLLVLLTAGSGCASSPAEPTLDVEAIYIAAFETALAAAATPTPLPTEAVTPTPEVEATYLHALTFQLDAWEVALDALATEMERLSVDPSLLTDATWKAGITAAAQSLEQTNAGFATLPPTPSSLLPLDGMVDGLVSHTDQLLADSTGMLNDPSIGTALPADFDLLEQDLDALDAALASFHLP